MKQFAGLCLLLAFPGLAFAACGSSDPMTGNDTPSVTPASETKPSLPEYTASDRSKVPAFPGAYGAGKFTTGGAGGTVYKVTSLEDTNERGTLRWALSQKGKRTIVFAVSGLIDLKSKLDIKNGDVTIAGQTAPGDGICIKGHTVSIKADNVIVRFLRFRLGSDELTSAEADGSDAFWGKDRKNIIIDHCSMSWSTDECASFYDNKHFTMQWCIISESLANSIHDKGGHGYGAIWGGQSATFHHNLMAHHSSRTPRLCGSRYTNEPELEKVDLRNNVFYNWGPTNGGYAGDGGAYNFVNNYYKPGPSTATKKSLLNRIFSPNPCAGTQTDKNGKTDGVIQKKGAWGTFWLSGNMFDATSPAVSANAAFKDAITKVNNDNWVGLQPNQTVNIKLNGVTHKEVLPFPAGGEKALRLTSEVTVSDDVREFTQTAETAYKAVLRLAGASLKRDAVDERIVNNVKNGDYTAQGSNGSRNGIIDKASDVGGWPVYRSETPPVDTDNDGLPDEWEVKNGLNPKDASDGAKYNLSKDYTNLEVYLNSLVADTFPETK